MPLQIRKATLLDVESVLEIEESTFRETYTQYNTPENMEKYVSEKFTNAKIQEEIAQPEVIFFMMEKNSEFIGFAKAIASPVPSELMNHKAIEIERIYVRKAFHGQKLGQKLIEHCCEFAKKEGFEVIWLGVWENNLNALGFYKRMGFEVFGSHTFLLGDEAQLDFLMRKIV